MRRLLLSFILIYLLTVPASAHSGDTDSSGGHYDHGSGDYHYHHGYSAHDHYDIDGDGDLDCPYSFVDKTGQNSGTPTSSVSSRKPAPTSTSTASDSDYWDAYQEGYRAGLEYGKAISVNAAEDEAYTDGYQKGYANGKKAAAKTDETELVSLSEALCVCAFICAAVGITIYLACRHDRDRALEAAEAEYSRQLREMDRNLRAARSQRDQLFSQQEAIRSDCQKKVQAKEDQCITRIAEIESKTRLMIQRCFVDYFDPQRKSSIKFPKDIDFHPWGVSQGVRTTERPFGDFTVYKTSHGRCYHTVRGCCGATRPVCVFEEQIKGVPSCANCTGYSYEYRKFPDWYRQYKLLLTETYRPDPDNPEL